MKHLLYLSYFMIVSLFNNSTAFSAILYKSYKDGDEVRYVNSDDMSNLLRIIDRTAIIANIDKKHNGDSLLMTATRKGNYSTMKVLISRNADINIQDLGGATPLHIAVRKNNQNLVNLLCSSKKINVNIQDNEGYTPLMRAVEAGLTEMISILVQYKSDKMIKNMYGMSSYNLIQNINSKSTQETVRNILK